MGHVDVNNPAELLHSIGALLDELDHYLQQKGYETTRVQKPWGGGARYPMVAVPHAQQQSCAKKPPAIWRNQARQRQPSAAYVGAGLC